MVPCHWMADCSVRCSVRRTVVSRKWTELWDCCSCVPISVEIISKLSLRFYPGCQRFSKRRAAKQREEKRGRR